MDISYSKTILSSHSNLSHLKKQKEFFFLLTYQLSLNFFPWEIRNLFPKFIKSITFKWCCLLLSQSFFKLLQPGLVKICNRTNVKITSKIQWIPIHSYQIRNPYNCCPVLRFFWHSSLSISLSGFCDFFFKFPSTSLAMFSHSQLLVSPFLHDPEIRPKTSL